MVEGPDTIQEPSPNPFYWATLGYAALVGFGWLTFAMARLLYWLSTQRNISQALAQNDVELAQRGQAFAGSLLVDLGFAVATTLVFVYAAVALFRRTWNTWDHATLVVGAATVFSLIFVCAQGRIMFFIPLTAAPLLGLLYTPGTKSACGVGRAVAPVEPQEQPIPALGRDELRREIEKERALLNQLGQNLDVFEVERGMDTDRFVARYTEGLEEENADNAEWFAIARAVRRHRERLNELRAQLDEVAD